jgi:hypothetical protein
MDAHDFEHENQANFTKSTKKFLLTFVGFRGFRVRSPFPLTQPSEEDAGEDRACNHHQPA